MNPCINQPFTILYCNHSSHTINFVFIFQHLSFILHLSSFVNYPLSFVIQLSLSANALLCFSFFLVFIVNLIHSFFHSLGELLHYLLHWLEAFIWRSSWMNEPSLHSSTSQLINRYCFNSFNFLMCRPVY